ncbi:MAG TPA: shikimate dehydrogenase [Deltaproteobacteria bacterium]|nr:shikimate dehydrogenase [Deltaproteobacteria bacterium]
MITGSTRVYTILAHPATHVTAPGVYNHLFTRMGLDMVYIAHDISPGALATTVASFSSWQNLGGFNVTIPHKEHVARLVNRLEGAARVIGAVNTVVRSADGTLRGFNTDGEGALGALGDVQGAQCLVIGAGGAARAVVHAFLGAGTGAIAVLNRSEGNARRLCDLFPTRAVGLYSREPLDSFDIVVQATPLAEVIPFDLEPERLKPSVRILETVMRPTAFASKAREMGLEVIPGHAMLYHQTRRNFEILTGCFLPEEILDDAFSIVGYRRP